jgi:hypothetical protein
MFDRVAGVQRAVEQFNRRDYSGFAFMALAVEPVADAVLGEGDRVSLVRTYPGAAVVEARVAAGVQ